ncbi:unnamed protein product [Microthlaspi erraticum]|uniref:beta-glucosidase n=1 Tax=Microthlaspi erraticum TaxID=1685480 RepID=A0A6D2IN21_9BRAS|nr:unnamed protein product [Microthlaspi erraticum]
MQTFSLFCISLVIVLATGYSDAFTRNDFPEDFLFGAATSAYQWEGAVDEDGRTPSVWDTFSHSNNKGNGDIACDGYHKYKEDVKLMAEMGLESFRFSISWTRLIPNGRGPLNPKGLRFYKNLIKELRSHGIEPHVTLYHYDLPQTLEDEYGGWIDRKVIKDFTAFADVCFREFGDDVKFWTTINEATIFAIASYSEGFAPPGHCSNNEFFNCSTGNSSTEPYIAGHNMLLAHASASKLYRLKYKSKQRGSIGLSIYAFGLTPYTNSKDDEIATERARDFFFGWMLKPLVFGDYPEVMKRILGPRLPVFTEEESEQVKGSSDFVGIIHYMTVYVKNSKPTLSLLPTREDFFADMGAETIYIGNSTFFTWDVMPWGLESVLEYLKHNYNNPPIYILENGNAMKHGSTMEDSESVDYIKGYIGAVLNAIKNGSDTRGYFVWSMIDLYELLSGYEYSYGMYYVNFSDPERKRSPKLSASWYTGFLNGTIDVDPQDIARFQSNFSGSSSLEFYSDAFTRTDFPEDFVFGSATSAYQWEGAADEYGRTPSVWDTFSHSHDIGDGDIACDGYHKYKEDVKLMAEMGLEAFRFSISWTRLIPNGRGPINPKGLRFYKNLIKELRGHGIEPHVTLHHYDFPQSLEDEYGGWINRKIIEDFTAFADVCFREFGEDVKFWTTIDEANVFAIGAYSQGIVGPGHCSSNKYVKCSTGNSSTEPYIAGHNLLLAHASASKLYRLKYKSKQRGSVGLSIFALGFFPYTNSKDDEIATEMAKDFFSGWMLKPLVFGDYPEVMKRNVGLRLPVFTEQESELVKGSSDFVGIIHYTTYSVKNIKPTLSLLPNDISFFTDMGFELIYTGASVSSWKSVPWGFESVLEYVKQSYNNPPIYVLENGFPLEHDTTLQDSERVEYIQDYIGAMLNAIKNGSDTRGYFVWSMIDLFELLAGYETSFGLYYVNFSDPGLKRSPKLSASWYTGFLNGTIDVVPQDVTRFQSNFSGSSSL